MVTVSAGERKQRSAVIKLFSQTWLNLRKLVDLLLVYCCKSEKEAKEGRTEDKLD